MKRSKKPYITNQELQDTIMYLYVSLDNKKMINMKMSYYNESEQEADAVFLIFAAMRCDEQFRDIVMNSVSLYQENPTGTYVKFDL
jgi:hypothetical protein